MLIFIVANEVVKQFQPTIVDFKINQLKNDPLNGSLKNYNKKELVTTLVAADESAIIQVKDGHTIDLRERSTKEKYAEKG